MKSNKGRRIIFESLSYLYKDKINISDALCGQDNLKIYEKSGLKKVAGIIKKALNDRGILHSVFIEFNILGTILDLTAPEKLNSFVYILDPSLDKNFSRNVQLYATPIINWLFNEQYTLYHHPDIFIDPEQPQVVYSLIEEPNTIEQDIVIKIEKEKERQLKDYKLTNYKSKAYVRKGDSYIGNIKFERKYEDILSQANKFMENSNKTVEKEIYEFHKYYHYYICNDNKTVYMAIPILGSPSSNRVGRNEYINNIQGQGVVFVFFDINQSYQYNTDRLNKDLEEISEELFISLGEYIRLFSYNYLFNVGLSLMNKARKEAVKSAKAAIMSRNMSHNLGSHVMAYLKQNLGSVIDIVKGNVIEKIVSNNHLNTQLALWEDYLNNEADIVVKDGRQNGGDENRYMNQIELPFLVGIGHFISYMQERQDYIATVSTDYVPYFSSLNFKDDIYDVLNPDLRFLRHTDRIGGRPDNILLSFIARSEGLQRPAYANILVHDGASIRLKNQMEFDSLKTSCIKRRENDIVIKFRNFDGLNDAEFTPVTIECGDQSADVYKRKYDSHNQANEKDLNDMRSFNLSLPGGIAGRQAVFSIIENIIRNAAKHGSWEKSQEKRLELTFDVYDCSEEDSHFMNSENSETLQLKEYLRKHEYFGAKDSRDLYILTITDNIPIESKKLEQLEEAIKQDYVYDDCSMVNENKGIKEIKISASWLRNLTHEEDEPGMAPILNVRLANKCLQYIICVPKVKKYAIICPNPELYIAEHLQSIYYYTKDSFIKERNKSFEVIAILDDETNGKVYEEIKNEIIPVSPNHIVKISSDDLKAIHAELKNQSSPKLLKTEIWQRIDDMYARMYGIGDKVMITIIDQKVADSAKVKGYNNETKRVECLAGENASGSLPPFVYKTHLETEKNFYDFLRTYVINKGNADLSFAEGISGGNSTDRLVRGVECDFTTEWYYRHLNAMRKRIAIFDERLFSKTTNLTDSELGGVDNLIIEAIEKGAQETPDKCLNAEEVQELSKIGLDVEGCTYQSVYECVGGMVTENKFQYAKSHLIAVNHYKNISIYNIIFNSATQEFDIYGYTEMEPSADTIRFKVGNVGKILRKGDDIDIIFKEPGFDYLSIHQGLLDKIYHQWGIVDSSKCKVTQAFYNKIMQKKETVLFDGYQYLLGLIIHSGRAKPSIADMPQKQPFIQYASLDHAMSDCKYTLVELLDNARYE